MVCVLCVCSFVHPRCIRTAAPYPPSSERDETIAYSYTQNHEQQSSFQPLPTLQVQHAATGRCYIIAHTGPH